ncbi:MAG: phytoene desaturase family protein [Geminicoccaceae bacterium]
MQSSRVAVVGAGVAGLVAAVVLAAKGLKVTVLERASAPGGKLRIIDVAGRHIDAGPTVFTLRSIFDEVFESAGTSLDAHLDLQRLDILARHAWKTGGQLDLFASVERSADAIGSFAGAAESKRFLQFCDHARRIYAILDRPFIRADKPSLQGLFKGVGFANSRELWQIKPFSTMWQALGDYFQDKRLRQLFGRYATYCGSSPFIAPATLMLVAHVEQEGVWSVEGGMHRLARALEQVAAGLGVDFRYDVEVKEVTVERGRVTGVRLADDRVPADAVVVNGDVEALTSGLFGSAVSHAVKAAPAGGRSLSAVTWAMVAETDGFPLVRHNVFFSSDYPAEFDAIFRRQELPAEPTVYVCAQDRSDSAQPSIGDGERLLCLINAPANGDRRTYSIKDIDRCTERMQSMLQSCGMRIVRELATTAVTTPTEFGRLFPATGGALYGRASHGWKASFERPACRTKVPGLYVAGGSAHPGPGIPMAALSGRTAALSLVKDLASTSR